VTQQIDKAKQRLAGKHYSIIAPSFQWIHDYCKVNEDMEQYWAQKTQEHGNITVLLPWKASYTDATLLSDNEYIGVRYFTNHRFQGIVRELGQPLITTSANISGHKNIQSTDDLDPSQQQYIDIAINDGELN
jgi:tRNA A37 threonylcarbamoyladenosine synthetase subunit TsaC/SUA5/YrdC